MSSGGGQDHCIERCAPMISAWNKCSKKLVEPEEFLYL